MNMLRCTINQIVIVANIMNDELVFAPEEEFTKKIPTKKSKILIVDDDVEVHSFTKLALKNFIFKR